MALDWLRRLAGRKAGIGGQEPDAISRMMKLTHAGRAALARGHAKQALQLLKEKHELVVGYWGKDAVFSATSAIDLADAFLACGDAPAADEHLEWALGRYATLGVDDERMLRAQHNWALCAYQAADYHNAEIRFAALVEYYRAAGIEHDFERAVAMDYLAQVHLRNSNAKAAEPLLIAALAIFERDGSDPRATAVCLGLFARLRYMGENYREAEKLQRRAIAIHEAAGDEMNLAKELDHLGASLAMRAQSEQRAELAAEAASQGERAVAIFEKYLPQGHPSLQGSKQNLAAFKSMSESIGKMFPNGASSAEDEELAVPNGHPTAVMQILRRAWRCAEQHDYASAFDLAREARDLATRNFGQESSLAGEAIAQMLAILRRHCSYLLGEPTGMLSPFESFTMQMRAHARRGVAEDETTPQPDIDRARRTTIEGLLGQAVALVNKAMGIGHSDSDATCPASILALLRRGGLASDVLEILHYARWIGTIDNKRSAGMAFEILQLHGDGPAAQGLASTARIGPQDDSLRLLRENYRLAVLDRDWLVRSLVEANDNAAAVRAAMRSEQLPQLEAQIDALKHQLEEREGVGAQFIGAPLRLETVQMTLRPNEAVLTMLVGGRAIFLVAVRPEAIAFRRVEFEGDLIRAMCESVVESTTLDMDEQFPDFDLVRALHIHDLVFGPLKKFLAPVSTLFLQPDGPLWGLPMGCLVTDLVVPIAIEAPEDGPDTAIPEEDFDKSAKEGSGGLESMRRLMAFSQWVEECGARAATSAISERQLWLADRYTISLMPSLTPLALRATTPNRDDPRRPFIGLGDPLLDDQSSGEFLIVPETRRILTRFAVALGGDPISDVIVGAAATLDRVLDLSESGELATRRLVCFATHATYPREDSDLLKEAGLVFSNGEILTAFDVTGLRLNADLVLLTACFTGAPSGRSIMEPLSGLAQAFLNAGTRTLLVSHWPVDVEATEVFATALAHAIAANVSLMSAIRMAEKSVRAAREEYAHPAFWSGFSLVGDGAFKLRP